MTKTPSGKKIGLAALRAKIDRAEISYERACRLADKHNTFTMKFTAEGDVAKAERYRALAHSAGERALHYRTVITALRQHEVRVGRVVSKPAIQHATTTGSRETEHQRKVRLRRERFASQGDRKQAKLRAEAGLPLHDPRTAAGQRQYTVTRTGALTRATTLAYADLFARRANATDVRLAACERYETLIRASHAGQFPEQSFEPRVDNSTVRGIPPGNGDAHNALAQLRDAIGLEGAALLYLRIIENRTARSLAGDELGDERAVQARFIAAVDGAARFFGLATTPALLRTAARPAAA